MYFYRRQSTTFFRCLSVLLALVMATAPSAQVIAQTGAAQTAGQQGQPLTPPPRQIASESRQVGTGSAQAPVAGQIDLTYVSPAAVVFVAVRPAQIMKSPPEYGLVLRFTKPFQGSSINPQIRAHTKLAELSGKRYLQSQVPQLPSFYAANRQTLVVAPDATLRRLVEANGQSQRGPLIDRVKSASAGNDLYVAIDVESLRPLIMMGLGQAGSKVPAEARPFLEAPNLIRAAELTFNLAGHPTSFVVHANDESAAQRLDELVTLAMRMYKEQFGEDFAKQAMSEDPVERAFAQYMERISGRWVEPLIPEREGTSLTFFQSGQDAASQQQLTNVAVIGILVALLLPAIQAAREAARRNQSMNQMKQLMLALHICADANKAFPAHASNTSDGKPLLSWRVHILPYLEQQELYKQFRLDEPWDSEHNRALIAQMPPIFQNPNLPEQNGKTNYLAVVGEACVFNGTQTGMKLQDITDGTAMTIMLVEAARDQAVDWTRPDDWEFNPANPKAGLGGIRPGGWLAAFADGSVRFISQDMDESQLKAMFTRAAGDTVPPGAF